MSPHDTYLTALCKYALRLQGKDAADYFMEENQHAVSVKAGAQTVVHSLRGLAENDPSQVIVSLDGDNAFNNIKRTAILETVIDNFPALVVLFINLYSGPSFMVFIFDNKDIKVIMCTTGVLQGCVLGTFLYACGLSLVLRPVAAANPAGQIHVFADDTYIRGHPAAALRALEGVKRKSYIDCGISYNSKGVLWSPDGSCDFENWWATAIDDSGVRWAVAAHDRGIQVLGSWVGSDEATLDFCETKLVLHERLKGLIKLLRDAQCAF